MGDAESIHKLVEKINEEVVEADRSTIIPLEEDKED